jgi:hypothetical protein
MQFRHLDASTMPRLAAAVDAERELKYYTFGWGSSGPVRGFWADSLWNVVSQAYFRPLVLLLEQDGSMAFLRMWSTSDTWLARRSSQGGA